MLADGESKSGVVVKNDLLVSKDPAAHLWIQEHPRAEAKLTDGNCQWEISGALAGIEQLSKHLKNYRKF